MIVTIERAHQQPTSLIVLSPAALQSTPKRRAIALPYMSNNNFFLQGMVVSPIRGNVMQLDGNASNWDVSFNESGIDVRTEPMTPVIDQFTMVHESAKM